MAVFNSIPEALSQARFLRLLKHCVGQTQNADLNPGLTALLRNYQQHHKAYASMPAVQDALLKATNRLQSQRSPGYGIDGKLLESVQTLLRGYTVHSPLGSAGKVDIPATEYGFLQEVSGNCASLDPPALLHYLTSLVPLVPRVSVHSLYALLSLTARKEIYLPAALLWAIEQRIISASERVTLGDFHQLVKSLNQKVLYDRVSPWFWEQLAKKVLQNATDDYPAGLCMNYARKVGFYLPLLYERLIPIWQNNTLCGRFDDFKEGFIGISLSPFSTQSLLSWGEVQAVKSLPKLRSFDIVNILRCLMINGKYEETVWNPLLFACTQRRLTELDKLTLYGALKGLELDSPDWGKDALREYRRLYEEVSAGFSTRFRPARVSDSEEEMGKTMRQAGFACTHLHPILNFYTSDYYLPDLRTVVEFIGAPFHISQVDQSLDAATQAKLRHLQRHKYHSIVVSELTDFQQKFKEAVGIVKNASEAKAVGIVSRKTGRNFTRLIDVKIVR